MKLSLAPDMTKRRADAEKRIDGNFSRHMAMLTRNADLYRRKVEEAQAFLKDGVPGHLISAEMNVSSRLPRDIAIAIIGRAIETNTQLAALETRRLTLKARLRAASTPADIDALVASLEPVLQ